MAHDESMQRVIRELESHERRRGEEYELRKAQAALGHYSGEHYELELVKKLRCEGFDNSQIATILHVIAGVCPACWDADISHTRCHCQNDE